MEEGDYSWACFKAHQAAEFAAKAILRGLGTPAYGHSVYRLLETISNLNIEVPDELIALARTLDQYYIPTRYPNAWTEGSPYEYYTYENARQAIEYCSRILSWVNETWSALSREENN